MTLRVKNWEKFQHYKDRPDVKRVVWIKLHVDLVNDYAFGLLDDHLALVLILLWTVAVRDDGAIDSDPDHLSFLIRRKVTVDDLRLLVRAGFLIDEDSSLGDSRVSLENSRDSLENSRVSLEQIRGEEIREEEIREEHVRAPHARATYPKEFESWWSTYPERPGRPKGSKKRALEMWRKIPASSHADLATATATYAASKHVADGFRKDAERFLAADYWLGWLSVEAEPADEEIREWMRDTYGGGYCRTYEEARRLLIEHKRQQRQEAN